jgi:ribokinase
VTTATLVVIGSINVDLVVSGAPLPGPGETVTGGTFAQHHGGKGGNQAVAAARALGAAREPSAGARVALIGAVGDDELGSLAVDVLGEDDVTASVAVLPGLATGVALIVVDRDGENQIAVAPGANAVVTSRQVRAGLDEHRPGAVLASLEVPAEAVRAAGEWCRPRGVPLVLNPAPMQPWIRSVLPGATHVTPNEGELPGLGDVPSGIVVLETRGVHGVRIHAETGAVDVPAPKVVAVDTTGAGDCFNGVFAAGLLEGLGLERAAARAVTAAALSTTKPGARGGMPTRAEIDAAMTG